MGGMRAPHRGRLASVLLTLACSEASSTVSTDIAPADAVAPDTAAAPEADTAAPDDSDGAPLPEPYPLDDVLRVNHLQCLGTHNSYHVAPGDGIVPDWAYTHPPLAEQLGRFGVRNFEIDSYPNAETLEFPVVHLPMLDPGTTCASLAECLGQIAGWSQENPGHHPLFIMLELKSTQGAEVWVDALDAVVLEALGPERVITPDEIRGTASTLREAVTTAGWPSLRATRGRAFVIVMQDEAFYAAWSAGHPGGAGRAVFVHVPTEHPDAAFVKLDDPTDDRGQIEAAVDAGFIVRTRADTITAEPGPDGLYESVQALEGGAQMLSTDFLSARAGGTYRLTLPGGVPSRCNPRIAPPECTAEAIESPDWLRPVSR